jgi:hypothetical protein
VPFNTASDRRRGSYMGEINYSSPELAEAVRIWAGWGTSSSPSRDEQRVIQRYGSATTAKLLPVIKSLEDEFYASDARFTAIDMAEMAALASEQFVRKHPGIDKGIVDVLAWCYTFDFK